MNLNDYEIHALIAANAEFLMQDCGNKQMMKDAISRIVQLIEMLPEDDIEGTTMQ
jgi:hypothetical protein